MRAGVTPEVRFTPESVGVDGEALLVAARRARGMDD